MRLARRAATLQMSPTLAVQQAVAELRAKGLDVIDLSVGEPDFDTPKAIRSAGSAAIEAGFTRYTKTTGIIELRQAIAASYRQRYGGSWSPESVVVSCGAKQAIFNVLAVTVEPGDEVIIPAPCWVSFRHQVELLGARAVIVPTRADDGFVVRAEDVEAVVNERSRVLILNSPSNPTGTLLGREALEALARLASERGLLVLSDETYDRLVYAPAEHASFASLHDRVKDLVIVNSFSKTYAMTGWRVGYLLGLKELTRAVEAVQSHTTSHPASIAQHAALAALTGPQESIAAMVSEYQARRDLVVAAFAKMNDVSLVRPDGAFYAFPDVSSVIARRGYKGSVELCEAVVREARVALVAGAAFEAEGYVRLSYAVERRQLSEALARLQRWFES